MKLTKYLLIVGSLCGLVACNEFGSPIQAVDYTDLGMKGFEVDSVDQQNGLIMISPEKGMSDSIVFSDLSVLGGSNIYVAADEDLVNPEIDWDAKVEPGVAIPLNGKDGVHLVVLDDDNRIVKVWQIEVTKDEKSSSSKKSKSSSSAKVTSSSSAAKESSSSVAKSSADAESYAEKAPKSSAESAPESSSEEVVESSAGVESSSAVVESSSEAEVLESSSEAVVESSSEDVVESSAEVESSAAESSSEAEVLESSSEAVIESSSEEVIESSSAVVEGPQLPGTHFDSWDKSFWGSTSDAMATHGYGIYNVVIDYKITMFSEANAIFDNSKLTLTTKSIAGKADVGLFDIEGGWKMAGGFYFAGYYTSKDAASIYMADNKDAGADNRPADFSQYMRFGRPFDGRPASFDVTYSYEHYKNTNSTYPQSSLIYVVLVSADNKIVAAGAISDKASVSMSTKTVELKYGSDAGLLSSKAVGVTGLTLGSGEEEVASIRVMFASSALAYVADGGTSSQMKKYFRGGEGSQLIIDEFKLNY